VVERSPDRPDRALFKQPRNAVLLWLVS